jgi:hypothetical protein
VSGPRWASRRRGRAGGILALTLVGAGHLSAQVAPSPWTLTPELRVGELGGPVDLTEVGRLEVDFDGRIYVSQPRDGRVLRFDPDGTPLEPLGRRGDGPGEFRVPTNMGWTGDTLWVLDSGLRRVTFFQDGRAVRILRVPDAPLEVEAGPTFPVGFPGEGVAVLVAQPPPRRIQDASPSSGVLLRSDQNGREFRELARLHVRDRPLLETPAGSSIMLAFQPFDDSTLLQAAPDGSTVVLVERRAPERSGEGRFQVVKFRSDGGVVYRRWVAFSALPVTEETLQARLELPEGPLAERFPSPATALRALREAIFVPRFHPPVTDLAVGRDGTAWVRREDAGAPLVRWMVLNPRGELLAEVKAPAALRILQADGDRVWGVETDDMGVPTVVRFRGQRGGER